MSRKFKCEILLDNDAFFENEEQELSRILRVIAEKVENGYKLINARDINGNKVGEVTLRGE